MGKYCYVVSAWRLRLLGGARGTWVPMGRREAGAYCVATHTACCMIKKLRVHQHIANGWPCLYALDWSKSRVILAVE